MDGGKMMGGYKVCMVQTTSCIGQKEYNLKRAESLIAEAAAGGADLVLFPEMYTTGYTAGHEIFELAEPACDKTFERMSAAASKHSVHVVYGYPELRRQRVFNSANFIDDKGELIGTYAKTHLFEGERKHFTPGSEYPVFDTCFGRVGMEICYDIEFPEPSRRLAAKGAKIIICIAASMLPGNGLHDGFAKARAKENHVIIPYCNYTGSDENFTYVGQSGVYYPGMDWLKPKPADGERLVFEYMDPDLVSDPSSEDDFLSHISSEELSFYKQEE